MVHTHLLKTWFFSDVYAATALTNASMKLNLMDDKLKVFDKMPHRNLVPVNTVISGLLHNEHCREALKVFKSVVFGGHGLNSVTIASVCSACDNAKHGMGMDCVVVKLGVESDVYVATSALFKHMPVKNVVSYNAFITGLLHNGVPMVMLDVFKKMRACRVENLNSVTLVSALSACGSVLYLRFGRQVHGLIMKD
ncbi:putative pentatricopeptide [Rosa chinensis]|uniref:Putative pentatricopeptide n=1 Tax=Rosa chinensis TaxID=74649 RepID=A0A2P6PSV7_ROSCH|nr:putative pentatricopeptide [Rosa chinensis]